MHGALNQQINGKDKWCLTPFIIYHPIYYRITVFIDSIY